MKQFGRQKDISRKDFLRIHQWQECCFHVKKIEEEYIRNDGLLDDRIDKIIINTGGSSSSNESEEEDNC